MGSSERPAARELECGSSEEIVERGDWLSRLMFGWMVGMPENRSYEEWLASRGLSLD